MSSEPFALQPSPPDPQVVKGTFGATIQSGVFRRGPPLARPLRQEWLADRIGLTRCSIINIEHGGRQRVHIHTIAQIAKALRIQQRRIYRGVL